MNNLDLKENEKLKEVLDFANEHEMLLLVAGPHVIQWGNEFELLAMLSLCVRGLFEDCNISKEKLQYAFEQAFLTNEELQQHTKDRINRISEIIKTIMNND